VYEKNTREISLLHPKFSGARCAPQALCRLRQNMDRMEKKAGSQAFSSRQKSSQKDFCRATTIESDSAGTIETSFRQRDEQKIGQDDGE
jgi:hypothetical protein